MAYDLLSDSAMALSTAMSEGPVTSQADPRVVTSGDYALMPHALDALIAWPMNWRGLPGAGETQPQTIAVRASRHTRRMMHTGYALLMCLHTAAKIRLHTAIARESQQA